jgi:LmbE family N-acetylglucosaminyl deacetylase
MNIVSIGAHQDDIDINCLGTLIKYYTLGNVTFTNVSISNGDKGAQYDPSKPYEEVSVMRNSEAMAITKTLGGHFICMGQSDWKLRIESMCYKDDKMLYSKFAEEIKNKLKFVYDNIGNYYCNKIYYDALSRVPDTVFIHIPIYTKFYKDWRAYA